MREDQDAELACCLDEAGRSDRLARRGRMAEPVAPDGSRVGAVEALLELFLVDEAGVVVVVRLLVELGLGDGAVPAAVPAVAVLVGRALRRGDELGEHPGEGIHLMAAELGPCGGSREVLGEHALEPEHEAVADLPARRRLGETGLHLLERVVEGGAACGSRCERGGRVLVGVQERLAAPGCGAARCRSQVFRCVRQHGRGRRGFVHVRSTYCGAAPSES